MNKIMRVRCAECDLEIECNSCNFSNYIDKEKLINFLNDDLQTVSTAQCLYINVLLKYLENGEFD